MTRKIIGAAFLSLDNVMQAPGHPDEDRRGRFAHGGWFAGMDEEAIGIRIDGLLTPPFDLLLGRRTYEIFAAHWPFMPADDPIASRFATCAKYVLTRSGIELGWAGSHRLSNMDDVARLRDGEGPDLIIQGSTTLYPQLLARGLIDRLITIRVPVVLGQGLALFGDGTPAGRYRPIETSVTPGGAVISILEPAGPVEAKAFALPDISQAERERRRRIEEGTW